MLDVHGDLFTSDGLLGEHPGSRMNVQECMRNAWRQSVLRSCPGGKGEATRIHALTETKESEKQAGKW